MDVGSPIYKDRNLEGDKNMRMDIIVGIMFIAGLTIATSIVTYLVLHDIDKQ